MYKNYSSKLHLIFKYSYDFVLQILQIFFAKGFLKIFAKFCMLKFPSSQNFEIAEFLNNQCKILQCPKAKNQYLDPCGKEMFSCL